MNKINLVSSAQMKKDIPKFFPGDTVKIHVKVVEGDKERIQQYQGIVMGIKGAGLSKTFRVRKISNGVGVERIFPMNSPTIAKIEKIKDGKVRRAKLYYLRSLKGKSATKIRERISEDIVIPEKPVETEIESPSEPQEETKE
ncbi:MAG: 50S ribosomal protein L19 [Chlorobi bacterium]|nr:50S ribosomal protein L19 [Chlorobiota bacterium]MCI0717052.1 50S ribosomal protein L19 [Chlorobiota bacterium]